MVNFLLIPQHRRSCLWGWKQNLLGVPQPKNVRGSVRKLEKGWNLLVPRREKYVEEGNELCVEKYRGGKNAAGIIQILEVCIAFDCCCVTVFCIFVILCFVFLCFCDFYFCVGCFYVSVFCISVILCFVFLWFVFLCWPDCNVDG